MKPREGTGSAGDYHVPVMLKETLDMLITDRSGVYMDGTFGGGGHSGEILSRLEPPGKLIAYDADTNAIERGRKRFERYLAPDAEVRLDLRHERFDRACSIEEGKEFPCLSGLLLDLGVSSHQLDTDSIGLSYRVNGPLDMRFGSGGRSAADLLATTDERDLERLLRQYGEEPNARRIARRLMGSRRAAPLSTTFELRHEVEACVPPHLQAKTLARVFQALRIAVNDELGQLERILRCIVPKLCSGARIVVLSYHSLEDRIVKQIFKELAATRVPDANNPKSNYRDVDAPLRVLTKRPELPGKEEIARNPRARSARMRVAERTEHAIG